MKWKRLINKILRLPVRLMIVLIMFCTIALIYIFVNGYEKHLFSCIIYVLSSYTLSVLVMWCIKVFPPCYRSIKKKLYEHQFSKRYFTDHKFKVHVKLYCLFIINLLYIGLNVVSGFLYHSAWFVILAFYYTLLAVMRFILVRFVNDTGIGNNRLMELKYSRLCGIILLFINLFLSGSVLMILYQNKGYEYNGILIYIMALYTIYITTVAVVELVKYRRLGSPVMSMTKIINMATALVSVLSLETAMFSEFGGEMTEKGKRIMIALTGAGVSIIIVTMSVYSIVKNSKEIKKIMENKAYGE